MPTKKHGYAELLPSEKHASQGKNVLTNTCNSAFPRALLLINVKMPTIDGISTFMSVIYVMLS